MSSSKKDAIGSSSKVILDIYFQEIHKRPYLWNNREVYLLWMRQVVLYFTIVVKYFTFHTYLKKIRILQSLKYDSIWFKAKDVPRSYKMWNIAQNMPSLLAGVFTYYLIKFQNK